MKRYHREVGFPKQTDVRILRLLDGFDTLHYSDHAKESTFADQYGQIPVIKKTHLRVEDCFEVVFDEQFLVKAVFRIRGVDEADYCYSVSAEGTVVTCWANKSDDAHSTLRAGDYDRPVDAKGV